MKNLIALIISGALVVSGYSQTRNVLVGTNNAVVQPTNFWSADGSNARSGLGLGSAATNPATAFQPSSLVLTNLASSNAVNLTNLRATNIVGVIASSNIPTVSLTNISGTLAIASGGTGATNAGGARTNLGLGETNALTFQSLSIAGGSQSSAINLGNSVAMFTSTNNQDGVTFVFTGSERAYLGFDGLILYQNGGNLAFGTNNTSGAAITRTNLGLGWTALTNTNTAGFNTSLYGSGTNPVLYNTNGEVVSPTNFWQVAPITTTFIESQPTTNQTTNIAAGRNLHIHSIAFSTTGITNTIALPTTNSFNGDIALVVHQGPTSSVTAVRTAGAGTNLITLNQFEEAVEFVYYNSVWQFNHNRSFIEPIFFSGTNAAANAAASRTNLGLVLPALTNTNVTNFRTAIGLGETNDVYFGSVIAESFREIDDESYITFQDEFLKLYADGSIVFDSPAIFGSSNIAATTRTNLGLGATWLTNTNVTNFRTAIGLGTNDQPVFGGALIVGDLFARAFEITDNGTNSVQIGVGGIAFSQNAAAATTRTNLGLGGTNTVTFAGLTNNGDITINQTTTNNGLLYIRRTNNESFLGLANLIASNNTTISNETLFRVGVSEATNKAAQFGFRSTNTNGNGVAVFSVFGYNALMMIGPSDPAAGTNPIEATVYSVNPTNKVMTLIKTNTGATMFHRPIEFENTTNQAVTRTNLGLGQTNDVTFSNITASGTLTATSTVTAKTNLVVEGFVNYTAARTNNTPTNTPNFAAHAAWIEVKVGTNSFFLPAYK